jgi:hypothetical protein
MSFQFSGPATHEIAGGDGLFQRAAAILMNSDLDHKTALMAAHAQMSMSQDIALTHATEAAPQHVTGAPTPPTGQSRA